MKLFLYSAFLVLSVILAFEAAGCGDDDDNDNDNDNDSSGDDDNDDEGECPDPTLDIAVCDPANGPFSLEIDNEWSPFAVGTHLVLEGTEDGTLIRVEVDVLDETEEVAGVTTRVVTETEFEDDELVEVSWNWFAQAPDGTVCYFGEAVDSYENGELVDSEGEWRAGEDGAQPGIIMPANPQVGDAYFQEYYEGVAEDMGSINGFGEVIDVPAGQFDDTMTVMDFSPLEGCGAEKKVYVRGIGIAIDEVAELISY